MKKILLLILLSTSVLQLKAQTNFQVLKQQFIDFRKADKQDSALYIARKMNQLSLTEQTDTSYWYGLSLRYLGNVYFKKELIDSTRFYWENALMLFEKRSPYLEDYASILNNMGILFKSTGDYINAEKYYLKTLEIRKKIFGVEHNEYTMILNNLAVLYVKMFEFKAAENLFLESLKTRKKLFGEENLDYAISLNNIAGFYHEIGDLKTAENFYKKSLEIKSHFMNADNVEYAMTLNNLGVLYTDLMNFIKSDSLLNESLRLKMQLSNNQNLDYAMTLNNLGVLFLKKGEVKNAKDYFFRAKIIRGSILGENHIDYAQSLNNLGILYYFLKDFQKADSIFRKCIEIRINFLGEFNPLVRSTLDEYAKIKVKINQHLYAYQLLNQNFMLKNKEIADNFEWLSDNQKEFYWKQESSFYNRIFWFANESYERVPEAIALNYNAALVTKSKMLEVKISSENYYSEVDELREQLAWRRKLLVKMESDGSTEKGKLDKLKHESDSLDKLLTLSWPEYAQQKKNLSITWDQVQQNLENGEAAIEFVRFKNEDDSSYYYNALVIKKGDKNPILVKLCKEKALQAIKPKMGFSAYYPLIWQPLDAALKDVKTIYYAPTGELYNVPFHAIYAPKGKGDEVLAAKTDKRGLIIQNERAATEQNAEYLMDRYTLHQLTSTRYLAMGLKQKSKETIGNTIAMLGGVNYDYLPGTTSTPKKNKKENNANRSSASASGKLPYLEGTKTEVEQINQQVTTATWQTKIIENNDATEETITKLEGKEAKGILHIATHGFAFPEFDFNDTSISTNSLRYSYRYSTNPMVRSGLILTGGNWAWTGSDTLSKLGAEQNGILTALEVSQLNLKKTKLVVLSACETGLGKIEGSEGTFGLKRGFKLAGVEQMIVSLWSVPDKETMELMTLFYSDLTKTLNPISSFEKAQKEMRNKYPTEPEKWAGFVLVR